MKLATTLLAATAVIALAGCNQTAGNNSATANVATTNAATPAPAATDTVPPADANAMGGGNGAKPADQPAGDEMMEEGAEEMNAQ